MSRESRRGATFEQQWCDYASRRLGADIERRAKNGRNDRGDVAGLRIRGKRTVVECKCRKSMDLAGWIGEAEELRQELRHDDHRHFLGHRRRRIREFGGLMRFENPERPTHERLVRMLGKPPWALVIDDYSDVPEEDTDNVGIIVWRGRVFKATGLVREVRDED